MSITESGFLGVTGGGLEGEEGQLSFTEAVGELVEKEKAAT